MYPLLYAALPPTAFPFQSSIMLLHILICLNKIYVFSYASLQATSQSWEKNKKAENNQHLMALVVGPRSLEMLPRPILPNKIWCKSTCNSPKRSERVWDHGINKVNDFPTRAALDGLLTWPLGATRVVDSSRWELAGSAQAPRAHWSSNRMVPHASMRTRPLQRVV